LNTPQTPGDKWAADSAEATCNGAERDG